MALTTTTTSAAIGANDNFVNLTSTTGIVNGTILKIDEEFFVAQLAPNTAVANPVRVTRGQNGTAQIAHVSGANAVYGQGSDFGNPNSTVATAYSLAGRRRKVISYGASGAIALPAAGEDIVAVLNGTSVLAMTIAAPTKDMDGSVLIVCSNGVAAHTVQFTGGLSGAGSSYDVCTINSSAPVCLNVAMAMNGLWNSLVSVPLAGTVTNITATVA